MAIPRLYLTGHISLELGDRLVTETAVPGRQGRLAFVFLAAHRGRPIGRDELAEVIWRDDPPREMEAALSALLSKLRALLRAAGWPSETAGIEVCSGAIRMRLPSDTWVDIEAAGNAIDEAEGALRAGEPAKAWGFANVAVSIGRRPLLPRHDAPWIEARRNMLRSVLTRGLECLATVSGSIGDEALAVQYVNDVLEVEPFRESAYRHLMRLHAALGNRAEALRVFHRCRDLFREELGATPSPQTEAVFLDILRSNG